MRLAALVLHATFASAQQLKLAVDHGGAPQPFPHIWEATGWCPPDATSSALAMWNYTMQEASWQNHAFIRAVPNQGLKYVRIHALLNLVTLNAGHAVKHPLPPTAYNWTLLDDLLDMVAGEHSLRLGFEIMGNPRLTPSSRAGVFTSWREPQQLEAWRGMVQALAERCILRYGKHAVSLWRWETWNEPDHACNHAQKMHAGIDCDEESWIGYWDACADGLRAAGAKHGTSLIFGGPGSGGSTRTSWVLPVLLKHLQAKKHNTGGYNCDYLQWHNKGMLPGERSPPDKNYPQGKPPATSCNSYVDADIVDSVIEMAPEIAAALPMGNEEADMMGGWSHLTPWHSDATNAAGMLRILAMHVDMINYNSTMQAANVSYGYHANDNAFLNYGDAWFQQRTLTTRFEMNLTHTVEVVRKPSINTMAMLSLLGNNRHSVTWQHADSISGPKAHRSVHIQPATPTSTPYGAIATTGSTTDGVQTIGVMLWNSNGTQPCHSACNASVQLDLSALVPSRLHAARPSRIGVRVYRMDLEHGNPSAVFMAQRGGEPKRKPYPTSAEFEAIRAASELPSCDPTALPTMGEREGIGSDIASCEGISVTTAMSTAAARFEVAVPLPQPSALLVHVCIAPASGPPRAEWPAGGANLRLRTTTTPGEVFVRWDDVESKCVGSYELFYRTTERSEVLNVSGGKETAPASPNAQPVEGERTYRSDADKHWKESALLGSVGNKNIIPSETIFSAFVHQQAGSVAVGCYSVRWKTIWGQTSTPSAEVCLRQGDGTVHPYVNA